MNWVPSWLVVPRPYFIPRSSTLHIPIKRILDFILSLILSVLTLLFIVLIASISKLVYKEGIFSQKRIGKDGKLFTIYKLSSMYPQKEKEAHAPRSLEDARITPLGKILRSTGLDELPQLWNVLFGTMSLVGPRPEMPFLAQNYTSEQRKILEVLPGITGVWQLSGSEVRPLHEHLDIDIWYVEHASIMLDIYLLVISPLKVWLKR